MRAAILLAAVTVSTSACRFTEVALVTVRNETRTRVTVLVRLPGASQFREDLALAPAEESTLLKYEEPRGHAEPISQLVDGMQLVTTNACTASLDAAAVAQAATRTERPRRWTVRVTPNLLAEAGCSSAAK